MSKSRIFSDMNLSYQPMGVNSLETFKNDAFLLLKHLNLKRIGSHGSCFFCENSDAMSIFKGDDGWAFNCHSCGAGGDVFNAIALAEKCSLGEAIKRLTGGNPLSSRQNQKLKPKPIIEPEPPVPNRDLVESVMSVALKNVLSDKVNPWLAKRGISQDFVEREPSIGFVESIKVPGWNWPLANAWLILIHDPDLTPRAVKVHRENPKAGSPKSLWLPFGTEPKDSPRHGFSSFWPPPENYSKQSQVFLCPGELKAAAICSAGHAATSITAGESHRWTPGQVARFAGRTVCINFDDDGAGHKFKDHSIEALKSVATVKAVTFGREEVPV